MKLYIATSFFMGLHKVGLATSDIYSFKKKVAKYFPRGDCFSTQFVVMETYIFAFLYQDELKNSCGAYICSLDLADNSAPLDGINSDYLTTEQVPTINISEEEITVSIDTFGAQEVFYKDAAGYFEFGTTLKAFSTEEINPQAISAFLHYLYIPRPLTIYCGISSLRCSEILNYSSVDGKITISTNEIRLNHLSNKSTSNETDEYWVDIFEETLKHNISNVLNHNNKVGLFFSGGKDSTAIAIAVKLLGKKVECITLGFGGAAVCETSKAKRIAANLGMPFRDITLTKESYLSYWHDYITSLGQPFGDPAAMPVFIATCKNEFNYDVVIDGTGIDGMTQFLPTTYERYSYQLQAKIPIVSWLLQKFQMTTAPIAVEILRRCNLRPISEIFISWKGFSQGEILSLTSVKYPDISFFNKNIIASSKSINYKTQVLAEFWEANTVYRKAVHSVSLLGKRVFYPLASIDLKKFIKSLPRRLLNNNRKENKIILRLFLRKYLPDSTAEQSKGSFVFERSYILITNNFEAINRYLSYAVLSKHAVVDVKKTIMYVNKFKGGDSYLSDRIWALLILHTFLEIRDGENK
ncbi:MAG: asparagine synthase [Saccharospirillaceae bacterium]|nr:asparagine synthase [Saccharospirillaceae bacterium]